MTVFNILTAAHALAVTGWIAGLWVVARRGSSTRPGEVLQQVQAVWVWLIPTIILAIGSGIAMFSFRYSSLETAPDAAQAAVGFHVAALALFLRMRLLHYPALQRANLEANNPSEHASVVSRLRRTAAIQALFVLAAVGVVALRL